MEDNSESAMFERLAALRKKVKHLKPMPVNTVVPIPTTETPGDIGSIQAEIAEAAKTAVRQHTVISDLLSRGYVVYSAVYTEACSVIALNKRTGVVSFVQVRAGSPGKRGRLVASNRSKSGNVVALVNASTIQYTPDLPAISTK